MLCGGNRGEAVGSHPYATARRGYVMCMWFPFALSCISLSRASTVKDDVTNRQDIN